MIKFQSKLLLKLQFISSKVGQKLIASWGLVNFIPEPLREAIDQTVHIWRWTYVTAWFHPFIYPIVVVQYSISCELGYTGLTRSQLWPVHLQLQYLLGRGYTGLTRSQLWPFQPSSCYTWNCLGPCSCLVIALPWWLDCPINMLWGSIRQSWMILSISCELLPLKFCLWKTKPWSSTLVPCWLGQFQWFNPVRRPPIFKGGACVITGPNGAWANP